MRRLLIGAAALSLLGGSAALADDHRGDNHMNGHDNHMGGPAMSHGNHWARGQRLPANYRTSDHYVDYRAHHLRAPPRGYRWVQADNNFILVAATTGLIASIIAANQ